MVTDRRTEDAIRRIDERVARIADAAMVEVRREYPEAGEEAARATAGLWLRRAAVILMEREE